MDNRIVIWKSLKIFAVVSFAWQGALSYPRINEQYANLEKLVKFPRIVLAIDVSESMAMHSKIREVQSALNHWISFKVPNGTNLGILQFSWSSTRILSNLVVINETSRGELIKRLPVLAQGETCVGCGLKQAIKILGKHESASAVVLITDAESSEGDEEFQELYDRIKEAGIQLFLIELGEETGLQELTDLTKLSGGLTYEVRFEEGLRSGIINALEDVLTHLPTSVVDNTTPINQRKSTPMSTLETASHFAQTNETEVYVTTTMNWPTTSSETDLVNTTTDSIPADVDTTVVNTLPEWLISIWVYVVAAIAVLVIAIVIIILVTICCKRYRIAKHYKGAYKLSKFSVKEETNEANIRLTCIQSR